MAENKNKRWGRRLYSTIGVTILVTIAYYICLFKGLDIDWFASYTKYLTYFLGFLVGGLTITDVVLKK